ncbi:protein kinase c [Nesidiocoris tenuis]|uniref:Protein kinase c n=1 Tax=Nesidiocoris tenuis TaxID=355587 RepID=A0ABN7B7S7_9HEMI|nr:protein kinase c [Nesidiocoris tenuis]
MSNKDWSPSNNVEEWSVHAQVSFTPQFAPQTGNVFLTTNEEPQGDAQRPPIGARATCSVTLAGHHTVTLTCSEVPDQPVSTGTPVISQSTGPQVFHFCHRPPAEKPARHYHPPPTPPPGSTPTPQDLFSVPLLKDAASQTSASNVPQVVEEQAATKKRKYRPYRRSPGRTRVSEAANKSTASSSDGKKNPRTVHIDVYCTGSESSDSSSSSDCDTNSTPQTVFESDQMKVVHARAHSDSLPHAILRQRRRVLSNSKLDILPKDASNSTVSTGYPSPRSSIVSNTTGGFSLLSESTVSSRFSSSVNNSSVATSWKDTDLESNPSFMKSDSFDYENSFDRLRIKEKEKIWGTSGNLDNDQPKRFYKRPLPVGSPSSDSSDDDDDDDDEEGLAWSFGRYEDIQKRHLKREDTVRHQSQSSDTSHVSRPVPQQISKSGSVSDTEASNLKKYKRDASKIAPSSLPKATGNFKHWAKAEKFGPVVSFSKKPGHHVGPSKNPDCSCDTCRYFFEHICFRNRTRSLGDQPFADL